MTNPKPPQAVETSLVHDVWALTRHYLGNWRAIVALASAATAVGLAFNWNWLMAAGIAPVLLSVLPCVAMCALGLCMHKGGGRSCSTDAAVSPRLPDGRVAAANSDESGERRESRPADA